MKRKGGGNKTNLKEGQRERKGMWLPGNTERERVEEEG